MEPRFSVDESGQGDAVHVALAGEIDLVAGPEIRDRVGRLLAGEATEVVVDLSRVTFLDSSGIGVLVACWRLANAGGKTFRAVNAHGNAAQVLEMTGVGDVLSGRRQANGPATAES